jgi:predicted GNAT family N-acyltransferase
LTKKRLNFMTNPPDGKIAIRIAKSEQELSSVMEIRDIVFVKGLNVPQEMDHDGLDKSSEHAIAFCGEVPIGCARIRILGKKAKLERIAVLKEYQGKGVGRMLMEYLIAHCRRKHMDEIVVYAKNRVRGFYEACGFECRGAEFSEAGIPHIEMILKQGRA